MPCTHGDMIKLPVPTEGDKRGAVCEDCVTEGSRWLHLRRCQTCGKVGCCDSSPKRHASKHVREAGHPVVTSMERREAWSYCFVDDMFL